MAGILHTHHRHALAAALRSHRPGRGIDRAGGVAGRGVSGAAGGDAAFTLDGGFVARFAQQPAPFGFNGLGAVVYRRSYARQHASGRAERWFETVQRVVTGTFRRQQAWARQHRLPWDAARAQREAQTMYGKIFAMKFLPPGRGLWAMGSALTEQRHVYAALNNCAFVGTSDMWQEGAPSGPFAFLMDAAMLGVGVGFDTEGARTGAALGRTVGRPAEDAAVHVVGDSREGWVASVARLIDAYLEPGGRCGAFDYSGVRPQGRPIRGFGGVASGPAPLEQLHVRVRRVLDGRVGRPLGVTALVDLMNCIGACVVSGNVRRTAEIAFGPAGCDEFLDLKDYAKNPRRAAFGWTSNNSVFATLGMDYGGVVGRLAANGEPGLQWMQNARRFGRMGEENARDRRVAGANPCGEQSLESHEACCLVETFPARHATLGEFLETLESAFLYAKTVTLLPTHWPRTNRVMARNRRVGTSVSGVAQFMARRGVGLLRQWLRAGYRHVQVVDGRLAERFGVPQSVKTTCVKPSGSVSLLAGATPGMHHPESRFCLRRVRLPHTSSLLESLRGAGYPVEPDVVDGSAAVVGFPVDYGEGVRSVAQLSLWEQMALAALLQREWADNQVSCTVSFDSTGRADAGREQEEVVRALEYFQYGLKCVSFLPRAGSGVYRQMPYEAISEMEYWRLVRRIDAGVLESEGELSLDEPEPERFCTNDECVL
ncbi:hypothetical protein LPJ53_004592 [Coemansia erecta]|uniref:ribonucleoside-triphosphate reductase (thioredoxin) n=1 Tax=Coemansia erecta TaxID=147472 RepID=A0A9W7XY67_9FUNG|nr:hypothetical protein LPJ53_004592 [Coemansia erecta]